MPRIGGCAGRFRPPTRYSAPARSSGLSKELRRRNSGLTFGGVKCNTARLTCGRSMCWPECSWASGSPRPSSAGCCCASAGSPAASPSPPWVSSSTPSSDASSPTAGTRKLASASLSPLQRGRSMPDHCGLESTNSALRAVSNELLTLPSGPPSWYSELQRPCSRFRQLRFGVMSRGDSALPSTLE